MSATPEVATRHAGRGHLQALDGVRGLAILMVLFHHSFQSNFAAGGRATRALGEIFYFGRVGVDLFFVLSGFLITGILLDTRDDPAFFKKFYGRRVLRIFPLYYGTLLVLFALTPWMHLDWQGMRTLLLFDLQNLRPDVIGTFMLSPHMGLYHFWSLAIEEQFYLVWPAAVFFIRDRRVLLWATAGLALSAVLLRFGLLAAGHSVEMVHVTTATRADSLLFGGILAMLYRSEHWPKIMRWAPEGFVAGAAIVAGSIALLGSDASVDPLLPVTGMATYWTGGLRYSVLAVAFGSLIVWSLRPRSVAQTFFQHSWLRFFGKYSYGIYVLHVPVLSLWLCRSAICCAT